MSWIAKLTLALVAATSISGCVVHERGYGHRYGYYHDHRCYDCRRW